MCFLEVYHARRITISVTIGFLSACVGRMSVGRDREVGRKGGGGGGGGAREQREKVK